MQREKKYLKWFLGIMILAVLFMGAYSIKNYFTPVSANGTSVVAKAAEKTTTTTEYMIPDLKLKAYDIPNTDALNFVKDMKIGWSLGNTFDATSDSNVSDELSLESSWCGIVTSQEMIDAVQKAGFNTIRIPVSWHNHVTGSDYTISKVWLDRVQEVVNYAYNKGMYVILNIHHDNSTSYLYPSKKYLKQSKKYIKSIWTQLADRFSDYDSHLVFEGMNEPRLVGTDYEWWLDVNDKSCIDAVNNINKLNQLFVNTVRNGKGKNNERYLMIPGYGASAQGALADKFKLPKDSATDKLILSVHAYTPYNFALQAASEKDSVSTFSVTSQNSVKDIDYLMSQLYDKFVSKKIPVVIGEFGARDKNGNTQDRINFAAYYIAQAKAHGITCCWWDNNGFTGSGENFGLLDRKTVAWKYEDIINGLMKYAQ